MEAQPMADPPLGDPPRRLPWAERLRLVLADTQGHWFLLLPLSLLTWWIALGSELFSAWMFREPLDRAQARIENISSSREVDGSKSALVYTVDYRFTDLDGVERTGRSYADRLPEDQRRGAVEWHRGSPERSRLVGMRTSMKPAWFAVATLAICACSVLWLLKRSVSRWSHFRRMAIRRIGYRFGSRAIVLCLPVLVIGVNAVMLLIVAS
jgi:hypothetical protein